MPRRRSLGALAAACLLAVAPLGCAGAPAPDEGPAQDVLVELVQLRGDVASGHVELRVTNRGDRELVIASTAYESSRWSAPMVRDDEARIPPGARRNLRLPLPEPTCDAGPLEHRATLRLADGRELEAEPADPYGQLEALDDAVCDLRAFEREVAGLAWGEPDIPQDGSGPAVLRLEVTPVAGDGEPLGRLEAIPATVLLALEADGERAEALPLGIELRAGAAPIAVRVPLVPGRCDLHAVAEDKQGTLFRIRAEHGDRPVDLVLPSPDAQRDALLDWVVARCAALP